MAAELYLDDRDEATRRRNLAVATRILGNDARPNYAIVDPRTEEILSRLGFTRDRAEYEAFLRRGLAAFAERRKR